MLSDQAAQESFLREIEYIFESLFAGKHLPQDVKNHYIEFNAGLMKEGPAIDMQTILKYKLDIEAIEFYLRIKFRNNVLTKKLHGLLYLIEVKGDFFDDFHVEKNSLVTGFLNLSFYTVRSIYKFLKGQMLVKFYGII